MMAYSCERNEYVDDIESEVLESNVSMESITTVSGREESILSVSFQELSRLKKMCALPSFCIESRIIFVQVPVLS